MNDGYDVDIIRQDFPILKREVYGKPLVYLDNGASAQKPQIVLDAMLECYTNDYANVHRGLHFLSNRATDLFENARESVRSFINATKIEEIIFTKSATEAINLVAHSFGLSHIGAGDEIVLSIMEHHSNIVPWHFLRERLGAKLVWIPVDDAGVLYVDDFKKCLSDKTKLVAITHMSNALGTITPLKEIISIAHERGIKVLVDGSQGAVHLPVDAQDLDADFYVMTGHKLYGPSGVGVLYGKEKLLNALPPFLGGGEMIRDVSMETVTYAHSPHRFEAGTPPIVQAIGLGSALTYINKISKSSIMAHEKMLLHYANEKLSEIEGLRIIGNAPDKGAIISFEMSGCHAHDIATIIDHSGVAVRAGTHCAQPLMARFGVSSTCRASFALYNTKSEIDILVAALHKARTFLS
jgi:cysteine desulfurase / selenocysteine lyase